MEGGNLFEEALVERVLTERDLDKFYTKPEVVGRCMADIRREIGNRDGTWLEPSAGAGAFLDQLPRPRIGLDLNPCPRPHAADDDRIRKADFLEWQGEGLLKPVTTVGNPPFGRNASLALQFIERAIKWSDVICFILPRTFEKQSTKNKVNPHLELVFERTLEDNAFTFKGEDYDVPCCFQIWRLLPGNLRREKPVAIWEHPDFSVVGKDDPADFTFQRVGARAGDASIEGLAKSWKSHHRIKVAEGVDPDQVMAVLNSIDWRKIRARTAGNPSIGKTELFTEYSTRVPPPESPRETRVMQNYGMDFDGEEAG